MSDAQRSRLAELEAEARYHRERYDLYRARAYGPRPTSGPKLRELQLASDRAQQRLAAARKSADASEPAQS